MAADSLKVDIVSINGEQLICGPIFSKLSSAEGLLRGATVQYCALNSHRLQPDDVPNAISCLPQRVFYDVDDCVEMMCRHLRNADVIVLASQTNFHDDQCHKTELELTQWLLTNVLSVVFEKAFDEKTGRLVKEDENEEQKSKQAAESSVNDYDNEILGSVSDDEEDEDTDSKRKKASQAVSKVMFEDERMPVVIYLTAPPVLKRTGLAAAHLDVKFDIEELLRRRTSFPLVTLEPAFLIENLSLLVKQRVYAISGEASNATMLVLPTSAHPIALTCADDVAAFVRQLLTTATDFVSFYRWIGRRSLDQTRSFVLWSDWANSVDIAKELSGHMKLFFDQALTLEELRSAKFTGAMHIANALAWYMRASTHDRLSAAFVPRVQRTTLRYWLHRDRARFTALVEHYVRHAPLKSAQQGVVRMNADRIRQLGITKHH